MVNAGFSRRQRFFSNIYTYGAAGVFDDFFVSGAAGEIFSNIYPISDAGEARPGDLVLFDSYLPHRSRVNLSDASRRVLYATYNRQKEGSWRDAYFDAKRSCFPPDAEREPGKVYAPGVFNVGNPIKIGS